MGLGKILTYTAGGVALGVGAVAAAPFTGGGSILGAISLGTSLAGAGAVAAGAAAVAGGAGAYLAKKEDEDEERREAEIAKFNKEAQKAETVVKEHEKHTNFILALSALGIAMANADGEISPEEIVELYEFVGGIASKGYPDHIAKQIEDMISNPPTFNEAMEHIAKVDSIEYSKIRNLLVMVMEADGIIHEKEKAFLEAFDRRVK